MNSCGSGVKGMAWYRNCNHSITTSHRKEKTMKHKFILMLLLILFSIFVICPPVYASDTTIYACYKKIGGQLRIVDKGSKCLPSEFSISWNPGGSVGPASVSVPVRRIDPEPLCSAMYGWCPDGFGKWFFRILDATVNESSVVAINVVNPLLFDYGCEVATKGVGEFSIICIGDDYVKTTAVLQYAVFNP